MGGSENRNIVLTGPGRSGTTLACHLLDKVPGTVALAEPIPTGEFLDCLPDQEAVCDRIEGFYREMREMALERGVVITKHKGGKVPDNTKGDLEGGVRQRVVDYGTIAVNKELGPDFCLAIKQPGLFTALLPQLAKRLPCYAIVRNPLAIMASLTSLRPRKRPEKPPVELRYDPEAYAQLAEVKDLLELRLRTLDFFFGRYRKLLPDAHVVRYEDIVGSGGKALEAIVPAARDLDEALESRNLSALYEKEEMLAQGERLLASEGAYWHYYARGEVEEILAAL